MPDALASTPCASSRVYPVDLRFQRKTEVLLLTKPGTRLRLPKWLSNEPVRKSRSSREASIAITAMTCIIPSLQCTVHSLDRSCLSLLLNFQTVLLLPSSSRLMRIRMEGRDISQPIRNCSALNSVRRADDYRMGYRTSIWERPSRVDWYLRP